MSLRIGDLVIGDDPGVYRANPCRFIAEISNNHNGDYERAVRLIVAAQQAGADAVKFQAYTPDEVIGLRGDGPAPEPWASEGHTMRTLYEKAQTPLDWLPKLFQVCRDMGMPAFSSVFGLESLAALERCACPAYKVARLDNQNRDLIDAVRSRRKPVIVSADHDDMLPDCNDLFLLYCGKGYPTPRENIRLPMFGRGWRKGPGYLGLSSHCLDPAIPLLAVARGCAVIEMHFMLDDEPSVIESNVSLTASQFRSMVDAVRNAEVMLS